MKPEAEESANRLWSWIAQYRHTKQPEFIADLKAVLEHAFPKHPQPAEDPDEWVIQDRVPVRVGVDEIHWSDWDVTRWEVASGHWFPETRYGSTQDGAVLSVRCRRRDLPKVEQAEQCAACDAPAEPGTAGCKDCNEYSTAICSPYPQPQKTRVRLFRSLIDGLVVAESECPDSDWQEIHHDAEGFYTID